MTRRGSLAYYLFAVVVGCLFLAVAMLSMASVSTLRWDSGRDFIFVYFLAVAHGWMAALIFAFLLRRIACALAWRRSWQWMILGGSLAILLLLAWVLLPTGWLGARIVLRSLLWLLPSGNTVTGFGFTSSPKVLLPVLFLGGAATAFVLFRVHRAFEPQVESPRTQEMPRA